jgi:hypothetical protein
MQQQQRDMEMQDAEQPQPSQCRGTAAAALGEAFPAASFSQWNLNWGSPLTDEVVALVEAVAEEAELDESAAKQQVLEALWNAAFRGRSEEACRQLQQQWNPQRQQSFVRSVLNVPHISWDTATADTNGPEGDQQQQTPEQSSGDGQGGRAAAAAAAAAAAGTTGAQQLQHAAKSAAGKGQQQQMGTAAAAAAAAAAVDTTGARLLQQAAKPAAGTGTQQQTQGVDNNTGNGEGQSAGDSSQAEQQGDSIAQRRSNRTKKAPGQMWGTPAEYGSWQQQQHHSTDASAAAPSSQLGPCTPASVTSRPRKQPAR